MKKILLLIAGLAIVSCANDSKADKIEYTVLSGKIENQKADKILLVNNDFKKEIKLSDDGTFTDTLRVDTGYYTLMHERSSASLFIAPAKDLKITTDAAKFIDNMSYEGKGAATNNFLLAKTNRNKSRNAVEIFSKEEAEFIKTITGFKEESTKALKEAKDLDDEFIALEKKNIEFAHLLNLSRHAMY
jgi:hypothetical protein